MLLTFARRTQTKSKSLSVRKSEISEVLTYSLQFKKKKSSKRKAKASLSWLKDKLEYFGNRLFQESELVISVLPAFYFCSLIYHRYSTGMNCILYLPQTPLSSLPDDTNLQDEDHNRLHNLSHFKRC